MSRPAVNPDSQDVLTLEESAALYKMCTKTFGDALRAGEVPGRKIGGQWRCSRRALLEYLEQIVLPSSSENPREDS